VCRFSSNFLQKKKAIFFALRVKVKKFKKMKKMPLFAFPHKAWGGGLLCATLYTTRTVINRTLIKN
jgi:hypothetical protein